MDSIDKKEVRINNLVLDYHGLIVKVMELLTDYCRVWLSEEKWISCSYDELKPIPITKENIEKYIDWSFEFGFNKSFESKKNITTSSFLMENIIDGSSDFEIRFIEDQIDTDNTTIVYLYDNDYINFGLDDTLHNLQNLFFISTGQELPIKKKF